MLKALIWEKVSSQPATAPDTSEHAECTCPRESQHLRVACWRLTCAADLWRELRNGLRSLLGPYMLDVLSAASHDALIVFMERQRYLNGSR